mgnify:CR=1 FL=1
MSREYSPKEIEKKWQDIWDNEEAFKATLDKSKPKYYALVEFPYPSGQGLHVGHPRPYTAMDIVSRKKRMQGYNVLFPMGWDAFGLPTENYAIKNKIHPKIVTKNNVAHFKDQLKSLGYSFDWSREINTTDPSYYKWTQWIFVKMFKAGLAYEKEMPINWCTGCKVGLSNEEVVVKIIHGGVGNINESDVVLASASNAIIIGFNVKPDNQARIVAEREKVDLRLYSVIYNAIEDVESALRGMLEPIYEEQVIGHVEIRQIFKASGVGNIAGSYVLDGMFQRGCKVRISREGEQIFEGDLASLKRFKDDVKEVKAGFECGLVFEKFNDLQEDDEIEAYIMVEVPR